MAHETVRFKKVASRLGRDATEFFYPISGVPERYGAKLAMAAASEGYTSKTVTNFVTCKIS
jgi:hypothetical protein